MRIRNIVFVLSLCVLAPMASFAQQRSWGLVPNASTPLRTGSDTSFGRLPTAFEANQGQAAPQVKFLFRGRGYTAFLTSRSMVLSLRATNVVSIPQLNNTPNTHAIPPASTATVQFRLTGAATNPAVIGEDQKTGRVNYFMGNDPTKWHTNVPTYARVRYKNVYPGIDLVYYGSDRELECDFAVAPGADPNRIQFEIKGANGVEIDENGSLALHTINGDLHFGSPIVYQEVNGQRVPVDGGYVVSDPTHVGFRVARYDSNNALVIDPVLTYSTYSGDSGIDQTSGIVVDSSGAVYIAGYTDSANFPLATLSSLPTNTYHVFVAKLDATGSNLVYADYIGGNSQDYGMALVLDKANNVFVTGSTESSDFPLVTPYQPQQPGPYAGFLTKLAANGSSLLYSTYLGGNTFDQPTSIAIDGLGQVHVAGYTMSQNFPVANAYQTTASKNQGGIYGNYGFLTKFTPDGSSLVYSTYLAGNSNVVQDCGAPCWPAPYNRISALAVDTSGNAYVTGTTNTYNFPVTPGTYQTSNSAPQDAGVGFVSKFSTVGNLDYSTYFYGLSGAPVGIAAIAVDGSGSAYVAGAAQSDGTFPITSTSICDPGVFGDGCSYAFVTKFDSTGSTLLYSTFLGPNNYARPKAIVLDLTGDAYVLASTRSGLFQTNNAIEPFTNNPDVLLVEIDPAATTQLFATFLGGSGDDLPSGIALDAAHNLYVAGSTNSIDSPTTQGVFQRLLGGHIDAFVTKISARPAAGYPPFASVTPTSVVFLSQQVETSGAVQTVTLTNTGRGMLNVSSIQITGDFAQVNNCPSALASNLSCTFNVSFTPTVTGTRNGALTLSDNDQSSPQVVNLAGLGMDFTLTSFPSSNSLNPGKKATYQLAVSPLGGKFTNVVALSCSGAPSLAACSISPSAITPNASAGAAVLTITTTAPVAQFLPERSSQDRTLYAFWMPLQGIGLIGLILGNSGVRSRKHRPSLLLTLMCMALIFLVGCAGGTGITTPPQAGTAPGTYTITVTGTSGALQHSIPVTLIVQ